VGRTRFPDAPRADHPEVFNSANDAEQTLDARHRLSMPDFLPTPVVIDFGDYVVVGISKAHQPGRLCELRAVGANLVQPGSGPSTLQVFRNGASLATLIIPAGVTRIFEVVDVGFNVGDYWQMRVASWSAGAAGLTIDGYFTERPLK
jgi:hypothetical protein